MNRPLEGASGAAFGHARSVAGVRAQTPLVVGSVRDQHGAVDRRSGRDGARPHRGRGPRPDRRGRYLCAARRGDRAVRIDLPLLREHAIRRRQRPSRSWPSCGAMRRLRATRPRPADLQNLPYAHVESAIALRPFTLLAQKSAAYPGPTLSDRGLSSSGSLLIDDGAPNYDIVAGHRLTRSFRPSTSKAPLMRDATQRVPLRRSGRRRHR